MNAAITMPTVAALDIHAPPFAQPTVMMLRHPALVNPQIVPRGVQVSHALANGYFVGTINRVGIEPLGDHDFCGQSYFVDPRGQFVGDVGDPLSPTKPP